MTTFERSQASTADWRSRKHSSFVIAAANALFLTILAALVLIAVEASVPASQRLSSYEADLSMIETGSVSPFDLQKSVNMNALPVQLVGDFI